MDVGNVPSVSVFEFYDVPEDLRRAYGHGGDEDFIILAPLSLKEQAERVAERLMRCDCHEHAIEVDGRPHILFVTTHA